MKRVSDSLRAFRQLSKSTSDPFPILSHSLLARLLWSSRNSSHDIKLYNDLSLGPKLLYHTDLANQHIIEMVQFILAKRVEYPSNIKFHLERYSMTMIDIFKIHIQKLIRDNNMNRIAIFEGLIDIMKNDTNIQMKTLGKEIEQVYKAIQTTSSASTTTDMNKNKITTDIHTNENNTTKLKVDNATITHQNQDISEDNNTTNVNATNTFKTNNNSNDSTTNDVNTTNTDGDTGLSKERNFRKRERYLIDEYVGLLYKVMVLRSSS